VWNKDAAGVLEATRTVEAALPFALLGFDCDNGCEFLNHHLLACPLAPLSQRRQRARRTEELDVAAATAGLRPAGAGRTGRAERLDDRKPRKRLAGQVRH
jgi:hypothetical protein